LGGAAVLYSFASGPDPRHTAAPGDDKLACATSLCHTGTALNGGGGKVEVQFSNGLTYTPGVSQTFTVVITDAAAKVYGFQMTARLDSNQTDGQAGDFTAGAQQLILCDNGLEKTSKGCAAASPVQFIEHSFPFKTNTISVKWTPPASNVGNVHIYVAANAANNDGGNTGDHIYTANYTLTPTSAGGNAPTISAVISAGAFNQNAGVASGSWLEIYGQNFSTTTRGWGGPDFNGNNAPTSLDGVSVTIGGKNAFVDFISGGQVNAQVPDGIPIGDGVPVIVTNASGSSSAFSVKTATIAPAVLAPSSFNVGGTQYVVAQFADQTFVGRSGLIAGVNFRPAKPGDTVVIYGIGFGPVSPANPAGVICTQSNSMVTKPNFRFGQTAGTLSYFGLVPNFVGLYQFNVTVPNVGPGDIQLNIDVGGAALNQNLFITVGQ
jgi:uncharacterized protein (TIGR03437 family)